MRVYNRAKSGIQPPTPCAVTMTPRGMLYNAHVSCQAAQSTNAAPKMTTNAPSIEPFATPNDEGAAPPAGGASAVLEGERVGEEERVPVEPDMVVDGMLIVIESLPVMVEFMLVKLALGPIALLLTVLTAPEMVARLLWTLATCVLAMELDGAPALLLLGVDWGPTMATWMRISSHCAPIHSSYRL